MFVSSHGVDITTLMSALTFTIACIFCTNGLSFVFPRPAVPTFTVRPAGFFGVYNADHSLTGTFVLTCGMANTGSIHAIVSGVALTSESTKVLGNTSFKLSFTLTNADGFFHHLSLGGVQPRISRGRNALVTVARLVRFTDNIFHWVTFFVAREWLTFVA